MPERQSARMRPACRNSLLRFKSSIKPTPAIKAMPRPHIDFCGGIETQSAAELRQALMDVKLSEKELQYREIQ